MRKLDLEPLTDYRPSMIHFSFTDGLYVSSLTLPRDGYVASPHARDG